MAEQHYGLVLTLGGAPTTPHVLAGVPGLYRPDRPTPVDGPGEIPLDVARKLSKGKGTPVELVKLKPADVEGLRASVAEDLAWARLGVRKARGEADGAEVAQVADEREAVA